MSVDKSFIPEILISDWKTNKLCRNFNLDAKNRLESLENISLYYNLKRKMIFIIENNINEYRLHIWEFKNMKINIIHSENMKSDQEFKKLHFFENNIYLHLALIENNCIKYLNYDNNKITLMNKIHVNNEIKCSFVNETCNLLFFVTETNKLYIINPKVYLNQIIYLFILGGKNKFS